MEPYDALLNPMGPMEPYEALWSPMKPHGVLSFGVALDQGPLQSITHSESHCHILKHASAYLAVHGHASNGPTSSSTESDGI